MKVRALYNARKPNGNVSDIACDACGKIGAAYIELKIGIMEKLICKSCLDDWDKLINKSILQDVMDSVQRRKEWDKCLKK